jgi:hypothetical protein
MPAGAAASQQIPAVSRYLETASAASDHRGRSISRFLENTMGFMRAGLGIARCGYAFAEIPGRYRDRLSFNI